MSTLGGRCRESGCFLPAGHAGEHGPPIDVAWAEITRLLDDQQDLLQTLQRAQDAYYAAQAECDRLRIENFYPTIAAMGEEIRELRLLFGEMVASARRFEGSEWVEVPLAMIERLRPYCASSSLWEEEQK